MLALGRKKDESIIINGNIEITILDISRDLVKIGIKAPKNISIHRKEIYLQIEEENKHAIQFEKNNIKDLVEKSKK